MNRRIGWRWTGFLFAACCALPAPAKEPTQPTLHAFERQQLSDVYYSEGVNIGDINGDGHVDVVYGPLWFAGPDFTESHEIYPPKPQNRDAYADHFFCWVHDFDKDGWNDVLTVGFPSKPAYVYRNPGKSVEQAGHWAKHEVLDWVSNESPQFVNLVGDERSELVFTRDGFFGYASINDDDPLSAWKFNPISDKIAHAQFGHGLGVGDVNGDGRMDVLFKDGWFEQPADLQVQPRWRMHSHPFAPASADMFAYDVDGDGDMDVITSLNAHEFGLAWYEQVGRSDQGEIEFKKHLIMGDKPEDNAFGLVFSELHTVGLVDMDGDGLKDIVTGKTYWSHHRQSPMWDAGAVVYWFKLHRDPQHGVKWIPHLADSEAGVGRQVVIGDVNADQQPDIVVGGMKGAHVLRHQVRPVTIEQWRESQPRETRPLANGLSGEEAAAHMTTLPGFQVQLAASEPLVHQPVAMTIDDRGRIWIAEAYTYPLRAPEGQGQDKIIILEDQDQDGFWETRKVFAEGLNLVSGLEVGYGGVWVGAAPFLLFIPDRDQDDRPDGPPQVMLDGFGYEDTHETLNTFNWGPDGWLYGCHGVFTHSRVGAPGTPDDQRVPMNAAIWRYHPVRHQFEVFAWGSSNPWGVDFNDRGQAIITACVIPHLFHVIQGGRYERQAGRHFNRHDYDDIKTIADHAHYAGNIRDHAWWGHEPVPAGDTLQAGGGHAHCGALVYLGDNFPESFRNQVFMNNIHGNRVNQDLLTRNGSGYVGSHGQDLVLANDRWFRGINLRVGPDGTVYLIDWYDPNACHRTNPEIWDRTNGRLYNIAYGQPTRVSVHLASMSDVELSQAHLSENDWYPRTARRLLHQRSTERAIDARAVEGLRGMLRDDDPTRVLRALWTLHVINGLTEADWRRASQHADEYVRAWTVQLIAENNGLGDEQIAVWERMASNDPSPVVRLYLASVLQRLPVEQRWPIASALAAHAEDAEDHNLPLMYWYGIEPLVVENPARALTLAQQTPIPLLRRFVVRRAAGDNKLLDAVVRTAVDSADAGLRKLILEEMLQAFEGRVDIPAPPSWTPCYELLAASADAELRDRADEVAILLGDKRVFGKMRQRLLDASVALDKRRQALEILVKARDAASAPVYHRLVSDPQLRGAAMRALAGFDHPDTPQVLIEHFANLTDTERQDAVGTLCGRRSYAEKLLDAIADSKIPRTELHAFHIRQLLRFDDGALRNRINEVWGQVREASADREAVIASWREKLEPELLSKANVHNGRRLYVNLCAQCHRLFGEGGDVGPDLTGSNRGNLDYVLQNIFDPSAVLGKDYRLTVIQTADGLVISGLIRDESDSAITLRTINDTVVVAKKDVEDRVLSEVSMMPEQLLDKLRQEEVRDLIAYLGGPTQVSPGGPRAPINGSTGRVDGAIEGEAMTVIGKTRGDVRNQDMKAFAADRWSGNDHLWWTGGRPGDRLDLELEAPQGGLYDVELVFTRARDYATIQVFLDERPLGPPLDMFNQPDVVTTGVLDFPSQELAQGKHRLTFEILGAHPEAVKAYMVGLDYVRLVPSAPAGP